jgi:c-di-GMP phosphodiesterase
MAAPGATSLDEIARQANVLIGRQPIFNRSMEVIGYELLYRSLNAPDRAAIIDGDQATLQVILNSFLEIGPNDLLDNKLAFINLTRNFIVGHYPLPFPPNQTVIEVLEDIPVTRMLIAAVTDLAHRGFMLALDDVCELERVKPLLPIAQIVKLDLRKTPAANLPAMVAALKTYGVKLLAEKVETQFEYNKCLELGFDFFQGYFFCKPATIRHRQIESMRVVVLQALASLENPNVDFDRLGNVIGSDVALSYKLLRLVNSGFYSLPNQIVSMRQALVLLGLEQLRGWMTLLMMSQLQNKPHELATEALIRARMSEQMARTLGRKSTEGFFLTGLLSVLDAYMDLPMQDAVKDMPISDKIRQALLFREGMEGQVLTAIHSFEQGDWQASLNLGLSPLQVNKIFSNAVSYSTRLSRQIALLDK